MRSEEEVTRRSGFVVDGSKLFTEKIAEQGRLHNYERPHESFGGKTPCEQFEQATAKGRTRMSLLSISCTAEGAGCLRNPLGPCSHRILNRQVGRLHTLRAPSCTHLELPLGPEHQAAAIGSLT